MLAVGVWLVAALSITVPVPGRLVDAGTSFT